MKKRFIALSLAVLIMGQPTVSWVPSAWSSTNAQEPNWFAPDVLSRVTPAELEEFTSNVRENLRYQNPQAFNQNIEKMAELYTRFEGGDPSVTFHQIQVLDEIFSKVRFDYMHDAHTIEINRLLYGWLEIGMAIGFSGSAFFKDRIAQARNARYFEIHAHATKTIGERIAKLELEIATLEAKLLEREVAGLDLEKRALQNLQRRIDRTNWRESPRKRVALGKQEKAIRAERNHVYGKQGAKDQRKIEKDIGRLKKKSANEQFTLKQLGNGENVLERTQRKRRLPLNTFPFGGNFGDFLMGYVVTAGPWPVSKVVAPRGFTRNTELLYRLGKEAAEKAAEKSPDLASLSFVERIFSKQSFQEVLDECLASPQVNLGKKVGQTLESLSPSELIRVEKWFEKQTRELDVNLQQVKKTEDWTKVYLYDRMTWTGSIYGASRLVAGIGVATLLQANRPQNWWFPVNNLFQPFGKPLRKDPKEIIESKVPQFYSKYSARTDPLMSDASPIKMKNLREIRDSFHSHDSREYEKQEKGKLIAQAQEDIQKKLSNTTTPLLPQPAPSEQSEWVAEASDLLPPLENLQKEGL